MQWQKQLRNFVFVIQIILMYKCNLLIAQGNLLFAIQDINIYLIIKSNIRNNIYFKMLKNMAVKFCFVSCL